ncbi:hypothetical protein CPC08DRAFT_442454 [Agrocybe pediades]|nr:hypothetical protein CPC08DRAFT_442454 [Agrocybe pediades]
MNLQDFSSSCSNQKRSFGKPFQLIKDLPPLFSRQLCLVNLASVSFLRLGSPYSHSEKYSPFGCRRADLTSLIARIYVQVFKNEPIACSLRFGTPKEFSSRSRNYLPFLLSLLTSSVYDSAHSLKNIIIITESSTLLNTDIRRRFKTVVGYSVHARAL